MYTLKELEKYSKKQLILLAEYEGKQIPKKVTKAQLLDMLVQAELPLVEPVGVIQTPDCSARIQRIRDSVKE